MNKEFKEMKDHELSEFISTIEASIALLQGQRDYVQHIRAEKRRNAIYIISAYNSAISLFGPANWVECQAWINEQLGASWLLQFPHVFAPSNYGNSDYTLHLVETSEVK